MKLDERMKKKGYNDKAVMIYEESDDVTEIEKAIGVFDSGLGGISVLRELRRWMPKERYLYFGDSAFAPYGEKARTDITQRCIQICDELVNRGVNAIVIACNTATSACVEELRKRYPHLPIVGMEPALKPAVEGKQAQQVIVMATRFTLKEKKFELLMSRYQKEHCIYKLPTPKLVELVEQDKLEDHALVEATLREYFAPYDLSGIDSIVLGCTHFVFFREQIRHIVGNQIALVDGNAGTSRHVLELLEKHGTCQTEDGHHDITILNSSPDPAYIALSKKLLNIESF